VFFRSIVSAIWLRKVLFIADVIRFDYVNVLIYDGFGNIRYQAYVVRIWIVIVHRLNPMEILQIAIHGLLGMFGFVSYLNRIFVFHNGFVNNLFFVGYT